MNRLSINNASVTLLFLALSAGNGFTQTTQYVTLETSVISPVTQYPVQTNQIVSLVAFSGAGIFTGQFPNGDTILFPTPSSCGQGQPFSGITNILFHAIPNPTNYDGLICGTFKITTQAPANVISNYVPADAIVIPASATGAVQIILESSPDLVNLTAAQPGTYGAAAGTNRFFRVRAVAN